MNASIIILIMALGSSVPAWSQTVEHHDDLHTKVVPVIVIGGGPAGLVASAVTSRAHYETILFTGQEPGGQLAQAYTIENWPGKEKTSGIAIIQDLTKQTVQFGTTIKSDTVTAIDTASWPFTVTTDEDEQFSALTIIIATGGTPKKLTVPGVKEFWGKGIGICTICDAPFDKGKEVAIIGNNDMALDKALRLSTFARRVTIVTDQDTLRISSSMQKHLDNAPNIRIASNLEVKKIMGTCGVLDGVEVYNNKTSHTYTIPVQSIYFALGFTPNSELVPTLVDAQDYIQTYSHTQSTSVPGIYAAGTVEDSQYQKAVVAAGKGMQAALDALHFLEQVPLPVQRSIPACKRAYKTPSYVHLLQNEADLRNILMSYPLVLVDFFVTDCPSCMYMAPILEAVAQELHEDMYCVKVDYEASQALVRAFSIEDVPSLLIFKDQTLVDRKEEVLSKKKLKAWINSYL